MVPTLDKALTAIKIQIMVLWVVTTTPRKVSEIPPLSLFVLRLGFRFHCCLFLL